MGVDRFENKVVGHQFSGISKNPSRAATGDHSRATQGPGSDGGAKLAHPNISTSGEQQGRTRGRSSSIAGPGPEGGPLVSVGPIPATPPPTCRPSVPARAVLACPAALAHLGNLAVAQSASDGALPSLYGATAPRSAAASTSVPIASSACGTSESRGVHPPGQETRETARRLWEVSEDLTGVRSPPSMTEGRVRAVSLRGDPSALRRPGSRASCDSHHKAVSCRTRRTGTVSVDSSPRASSRPATRR